METETLQEKCRTVMMEHLVSIGYPKLSNQEILNQCKPMWVKLEEAGLTSELKAMGHTFLSFVDRANVVAFLNRRVTR